MSKSKYIIPFEKIHAYDKNEKIVFVEENFYDELVDLNIDLVCMVKGYLSLPKLFDIKRSNLTIFEKLAHKARMLTSDTYYESYIIEDSEKIVLLKIIS